MCLPIDICAADRWNKQGQDCTLHRICFWVHSCWRLFSSAQDQSWIDDIGWACAAWALAMIVTYFLYCFVSPLYGAGKSTRHSPSTYSLFLRKTSKKGFTLLFSPSRTSWSIKKLPHYPRSQHASMCSKVQHSNRTKQSHITVLAHIELIFRLFTKDDRG